MYSFHEVARTSLFEIFTDVSNIYAGLGHVHDSGLGQRIKSKFPVPEYEFSQEHPDGHSQDYCFYVPMAEGAEAFSPQKNVENGIVRPAISQVLRSDYSNKRSYFSSPNLLHIGTGGLMNLDMAASARADAIVLCDLNPNQLQLWDRVIELITESISQQDLFEKLFAHAFSYTGTGFDISPPVRVHLGETRANAKMTENENGSMSITYDNCFLAYHFGEGEINHYFKHSTILNSRRAYRHIKDLAQRGKIATAYIDLTNDQICEKARLFFEEEGYVIGSIFTANISYYFKEDSEVRTRAMRKAKSVRGEASDYFDRHSDKATAQEAFSNAMKAMAANSQTSVYNLVGDGVIEVTAPGQLNSPSIE